MENEQGISLIYMEHLPLEVRSKLVSAFPEADGLRLRKTDKRGVNPVGKPITFNGLEITSYWDKNGSLLLRVVDRNDNWKLYWYEVVGSFVITKS